MKSNNSTALAVAATAAIAVIALCAVLRSDTMKRRGGYRDDAGNERRQLERWDGEGGSLPDEVAISFPESGSEHA